MPSVNGLTKTNKSKSQRCPKVTANTLNILLRRVTLYSLHREYISKVPNYINYKTVTHMQIKHVSLTSRKDKGF